MTNIQNQDSQFSNLNLPFKKVRPDDVLGNLPKPDQDRILEWLEHTSYRDVVQQIALPAPEGLGLKIQYNSLRKFYLKHLPTRLADERPDETSDWSILAEQAEREPIEFRNLIREALEREVYISLLHSEPASTRPIKLLQCLLRWRGQELRQTKSSTKSPAKQAAPSSDLAKILASEKIAAANSSTPASSATSAPPIPADPATSANTKSSAVPNSEAAPISPASTSDVAMSNPPKFESAPATSAPSAAAPTTSTPSEPRPAPLGNPLHVGKSSSPILPISGSASAPESFQPINLEILKKAISMVNAKYGIPGPDVPTQPFSLTPHLREQGPVLRTPALRKSE